MRARTFIAIFGALAIVGALSLDTSPPGAAATALVAPHGPQSFPEAQDVKQGCGSHHKGVCGCNAGAGRQLCCDGATSPTCGC
jgi:hypothetical protein